MTQHIRSRRRLWARAAIALACAGAVSLTGLPGWDQAEAKAKPPLKQGKRCDEEYKDFYDFSDVVEGGLPDDGYIRPDAERDEYDYVNGQKQWDGLRAPTADELKEISDNPDDYKKGDRKRVWAYYKKAQKTAQWKGVPFETYRDDFYIPKGGNDPRGKAYMAKLVHDFGLVGPDWICEKEFEVIDPDTKERYVRRADAYNQRTGEIVEGKSNDKPDPTQRPKDKALLKDPNHKDKKISYAYGRETKGGAKNHDADLRKIAPDRVKKISYKADAVEKAPSGTSNSPTRRVDPYMNAKPGTSTGSRGGGNDMIQKSPENPKQLADRLQRIGRIPGVSQMPTPGGIDFSTLELQYVGTPVKGEGLDYSFGAKEDPDNDAVGWGGRAKAQMASDAFFTWLALTPDKFWVNLNPDTPGTIMDDKFAATDAGRVLLEADLRLKHDFFKAMDPKTDLGKNTWDRLSKVNGWPCLTSTRNWIEPKPAKVREQDGGIYILDAPLKLQSEYAEVNTPGPGGKPCQDSLTKAEIEHNERVFRSTVVPEVEKWINEAPQYADLRRVYKSRVAAEFVRQQDAQRPTDYRTIINSNDVKQWPIRAPHQDWKKTDVFDKYVKVFKEGEFKYELTKGEEVWVISVGGVDLSKQPKRNVTQAEFRLQNRHLPRQTKTSVKALTDDTERERLLLLGGNSNGQKDDDSGSTPSPGPTDPTDPPNPTDPPSTPAPDPTTPGPGDGTTAPPANKPDPDGGLADTGSGTPVGLITGIAAAIVALGGGLVWWMRRRKALGT
ncbi:hypothetical protein ABZ958_14210 [Streptomyces sp. NPDC046237]|uniref:hypothetical protein n=1 Tax=Streptomyces sp. NPDC046237 TaxID=3154914 RepID=UPI0033E174B4